MTAAPRRTGVDLPLDVQSRSGLDDLPFSYLDEAADPAAVVPGAHLVAGDADNPVLVRVVSVGPDGRVFVQVIGALAPHLQ